MTIFNVVVNTKSHGEIISRVNSDNHKNACISLFRYLTDYESMCNNEQYDYGTVGFSNGDEFTVDGSYKFEVEDDWWIE